MRTSEEVGPRMSDSTGVTTRPALPILVTGVTGVAGYNAFMHFRSRYPGQVFAIRQRSNWPMTGEGILACDAEDRDALARIFDAKQFGTVLNCAGNCALKSCELDPAMAYRINLTGVRSLLDVIAGRSVRFLHVSIDLVFSGRGQGGHFEDDPPDPVTVYGQSMVAAEHLVWLAQPDACMLRISLPMGISYSGHAGAIDWIQSRFQANKPATLYYDEIRTPTYTDCLNQVFHHAMTHPMQGLFHAGGPLRWSLYQIAQIVNRVGGYDPGLLIGCYRRQAGPMPPRAGNVTLNSGKLAKTFGRAPFAPWPWYSRHRPTDRRWHFDRSSEEPGSPELLANVLYRNPSPADPSPADPSVAG